VEWEVYFSGLCESELSHFERKAFVGRMDSSLVSSYSGNQAEHKENEVIGGECEMLCLTYNETTCHEKATQDNKQDKKTCSLFNLGKLSSSSSSAFVSTLSSCCRNAVGKDESRDTPTTLQSA